MNPETWAALQKRGVTESTPLALDFSYVAETEAAAKELVAYLREETDYAVSTEAATGEDAKGWTVEGTTLPQPLSLDVIDEWVGWMVEAGEQHGGCVFDGWGALVP